MGGLPPRRGRRCCGPPKRSSAGEARGGVLRRAPARAPRHPPARHGLLPGQQRGRHRRRAGRPGRAGADRRLRRPPRQRHPGHLLRSTRPCLYVSFHQYPLYPGTGRDRRERGDGAGFGCTSQLPVAAAGTTGDVYRRPSTGSSPRWPRLRADVAAHLGRVRRPPPRPAHRPRPQRRATSRDSPSGWSSCAGRPLPGRSSRAATTSQALADSIGRDHGRASSASSTCPRRPPCGGPGHRVVDAVAERWRRSAPGLTDVRST